MKTLGSDFKSFLIKGDLVSIAVGLVMALVFAAVIKALIADLITPIIALIFGQPNFEALSFSVNSSHFMYGDFINNVVTFVTTGAAVFFFVQALRGVHVTADQERPHDQAVPGVHE